MSLFGLVFTSTGADNLYIHLGRHTCSANSAANCMLSVGFSITFILALLKQQGKQMLNKKSKQENGKKSYQTEE
jgi:hypothetical protein